MSLAQSESESGAPRVTLRSRVSPFVAGRVVISTIILGTATLVQLTIPGAFPINPFYFLIGLTYGLSVVYLATLRYVDENPWLVDLQLTVDAALVSAFIFVTGGIKSDFSSLYLLPILAASTLRHRRGALQVAAVSAVLYLGIVLSQYTTLNTFPHWAVTPESGLPAPRFAQYVLATNLFGFLAVGSLAGALADRLRFAGSRLATTSETLEDLRAFNEHVINSLVSGLVTADADCRILTFNRAASTITGVAVPKAVGRNVASVLGLPPHFVNRLSTLGRTRSQRGDFGVRTEDGGIAVKVSVGGPHDCDDDDGDGLGYRNLIDGHQGAARGAGSLLRGPLGTGGCHRVGWRGRRRQARAGGRAIRRRGPGPRRDRQAGRRRSAGRR